MTRAFAGAVVAVVALAGGCAAPARYVEKGGDTGVVAIPANSDAWPNYHRREALALIQRHVGPNYEIVDEREVVTGSTTMNNQQVSTQRPAAKGPPGEIQTVSGVTAQTDQKEWRIWYRKTDGPAAGGGSARGPGDDMVPSVFPGGGTTRTLGGGAGTHTMGTGAGPRHAEGFPLGVRPAGGTK